MNLTVDERFEISMALRGRIKETEETYENWKQCESHLTERTKPEDAEKIRNAVKYWKDSLKLCQSALEKIDG